MTYSSILLTFIVQSTLMTLVWLFQYFTGNAGWVDTVWSYEVGIGGIMLALLPFFDNNHYAQGLHPRQTLVSILVFLWSFRLGTHIFLRTIKATEEDPRYKKLRQIWADKVQVKMFLMFQFQAVVAFLMSLCVGVAAHSNLHHAGLTASDYLGAMILLVSVYGEHLADSQLKHFAHNPANRGQICEVGLWRYTRHPNYVFEALAWVAYPIISTNLLHPSGIRFGLSFLFSFFAPVFMYLLLRYLSGVPPLERHMIRKHGDKFRDYQKRVNVFMPWFPKRSAE